MSKDRPKPEKIDKTAETTVEDQEIELKVTTSPRMEDGSRPDLVVRRVVRRVSKAQWYCAADESDERIKKFASILRKWRIMRKWNQTEAAEACGMTQPQWSNLESGQIEPVPNKVFEIERELGMEPGDLSKHLGYLPHGGDDRELFTQVAEKLDRLLIDGALAVELVLEHDEGATLLQKFLEDADKIGVDVIAALAKVSGTLVDTLNVAVDKGMPKVFRMKQAEMKNLSSRLVSLDDSEGYDPYTLVNGYKPRKRPHPEALKQFELGWIDSPYDEPIGGTNMTDDFM